MLALLNLEVSRAFLPGPACRLVGVISSTQAMESSAQGALSSVFGQIALDSFSFLSRFNVKHLLSNELRGAEISFR
jgi:hypothetical protein